MTTLLKAFWEPKAALYHGGAVVYVVAGYGAGLYGLFLDNWLVNLLAVLLLAHAMTIAAYMIHECGHNTVFRSNKANARLGRFLNWVCGSAYGTYEDIRYKHFRHHVDNDDVVWFEYERFFDRHSVIVKVTRFLEWFYVPAHDLIMHFIMAFTSFIIPQRKDQRVRQVIVLAIRGGVFFTVLYFYPRAAILYAVAYMIMMNILRFMDSLQHDYGANPTLFVENPELRFGGKETEQAHTFSVPLSLKHDWINWFTLNFGFHNAHHMKPTTPWYRLPAIHRELLGSGPENVITFPAQLKIFHKYRVCRVTHSGGELGDHPEPMGKEYLKACQEGRVYGGNAVSFLMSF